MIKTQITQVDSIRILRVGCMATCNRYAGYPLHLNSVYNNIMFTIDIEYFGKTSVDVMRIRNLDGSIVNAVYW